MTAWEPVRPAYFTIPFLPVERRAPSEWLADGEHVWGSLALRLTAAPDAPLHVGSGGPRVVNGRLVAAQASVPRLRQRRLVPEPVVPGSSIKGAVRVVVEALSPSCDPLGQENCSRTGRGRLCPACLVFGAPGWRGRLAFGDGIVQPGDDGQVPARLYKIPQRYSHPRAPRRGRRLYGPEPESPAASQQERLEALPGGSAVVTTLMLDGMPAWGVGLVAVALGLPPEGLPHLRVGGGKNRGMGIVTCELERGWYATSLADVVSGRHSAPDHEVGPVVVERWQHAALGMFSGVVRQRDLIARRYSRTVTD